MSIVATGFPDSAWTRNSIHRAGAYHAEPMPERNTAWQVCDVFGTVAMGWPNGAIACGEEQARRIATAWNSKTGITTGKD